MKNEIRPNIVLIHTDQQRGDCLSCEGHPVLQTPNMDNIARHGIRFHNFYSACPSCIAARRSLLTGQSPQKHGLVGYCEGLEFNDPTLPQVLRDNGYQTAHIGRSMHQYPVKKRYGFEEIESIDHREHSEYEEWFEEQKPGMEGYHMGAGVMHNDWTARPWELEEYMHPTNWTVSRALRFLRRRDPSRPFFLSLGFVAPHPPLNPPAYYFERYLRLGVPEPVIGDWAEYNEDSAGDSISNTTINFSSEQNLCTRAGYYGLINHVDDQLRRLINPVLGIRLMKDTIVIFTSDHGEMLGDHYLWRKSYPFEGAARVPFIMSMPKYFGIKQNIVINQPATHSDIMPTILDVLNIDIPETVDGQSFLPLLRGEKIEWRNCVHIEHTPNEDGLTDGKHKYIWHPGTGRELFFDLINDPNEKHNIGEDTEYEEEIKIWRQRLIERLRNRPEGYVKNGQLLVKSKRPSVISDSNKK